MDIELIQHLQDDGLVSAEELQALTDCEEHKVVSVNADLKMLLYIGIVSLCAGLGIIVYKNIDSIGHVAIIAAIGVTCAACFFYCFKLSLPLSRHKVESPNLWFDYVLLLGSLLMLTFVGYIQYQYHFFGSEWGLATFIPMVALFFMAYYFDHAGVLSLAITLLGAWMGIALKPMSLIRYGHNDWEALVWNGVALGLLLHLMQLVSERFDLKVHFGMVYKNFGVHVLLVALICGMFVFNESYFIWWLAATGAALFHFYEAMKHSSFYFVLVSVLYAYFDLSYIIVRLLDSSHMIDPTAVLLYFAVSGVGLVFLLIGLNKKLRQHDSIQ